MLVRLYYVQSGNVSIHAPREGRDDGPDFADADEEVSIHAPREGRDFEPAVAERAKTVSIHAPREGRDPNGRDRDIQRSSFNPRAPRGARRTLVDQ